MRKRSKLFVDYPVQGALVRQLLLHWVIACCVIFFFLFVMQMFRGGLHTPFSMHMSQMWEQYGVLLIVLATVFPVFVFDSIRMSHRFAGPMVSFGRALEKLAQGEQVPEVHFRKSDFWKQMADNLNRIANRLELSDKDAKRITG